jgi:hypothetical protein
VARNECGREASKQSKAPGCRDKFEWVAGAVLPAGLYCRSVHTSSSRTYCTVRHFDSRFGSVPDAVG